MYVFEYMLDGISSLFEFNNYPLVGKAYSIMLYVAGLSFRDISEEVLCNHGFLGGVLGDGFIDS